VETPAPETPASSDAENAAIISSAQSRTPQKQVFQPPREDEKFVYHQPATVPPQAVATTSPAATPQATAPEGQVAQGPVQTEVTGPAAVPPTGRGAPKIALLPPEAPAPAPAQPVQQRAPTTAGTAATTKAKPPAAAPVQTAASLPRTGATGSYFLQLAAYGTEQVARDLAAKLAPTYPALVLTPSSPGSSVFKVVIGPLNRAESGTLLTWFRFRGFPDAFLKQE
jgi:hypothetical protein